MASVTKDSIDINNNAVLIPDYKVGEDIPYEFTGVNRNTYPVQIKQVPSCGCTKAEVGEITVQPGQTFSLKGILSPRHSKLTYSKSVTLYYAGPGQKTSSPERNIVLQFTGKTV